MNKVLNAHEFLRANFSIQHEIPLNSLVEVILEDREETGVRGFVVEHTRDCDGNLFMLFH